MSKPGVNALNPTKQPNLSADLLQSAEEMVTLAPDRAHQWFDTAESGAKHLRMDARAATAVASGWALSVFWAAAVTVSFGPLI